MMKDKGSLAQLPARMNGSSVRTGFRAAASNWLAHVERQRELSSAGSEHLPYKQGVTGSNPVAPTKNAGLLAGIFYTGYSIYSH